MNTETYTIPERNLSYLENKLAKLNKKTAKLNLPPILMSSEFSHDVEDKKTGKVTRFFSVEVTGEQPKLAGWTFLATLQHTDAGTVIAAVPGADVPVEYREADASNCDHCQTCRRRKDTFLVRNDEGEIKQIGRACLRDFLGHKDPHQVAMWAQWLGQIAREFSESEYETFGVVEDRWSLERFLGYVAFVMRLEGWRSRGVAREHGGTATADDATGLMLGYEDTTEFYRKNHGRATPQEQDTQLVEKALAWARETLLDADAQLSDYEHNLAVVVQGESVERRTIGVAASLIRAYEKAMGKVAAKKERRESNWHGQIGDRGDWNLTLVFSTTFEGHYGSTTLYKFEDEDGNVFAWFCTAAIDRLETGKTYVVRGTVKKHDSYNGQKQTIINRCKVL